MTRKPSTVATAKDFCHRVYVIGTTTFTKVYSYPDVLFNRHVLAFFETSDLKEVRVSFFISTIKVKSMLIQSFRMTLSHIMKLSCIF